MEDRIGAEECGKRESNVSTRTSMTAGSSSPSASPSPSVEEELKALSQHTESSLAASEKSPGWRSI